MMLVAALGLLLAAAGIQADAPATVQAAQSAPKAENQAGEQTPAPAATQTAAPGAVDGTKREEKKKPKDGVRTGGPVQAESVRTQRKAAKLYLDGVRLLEKQRAEDAWKALKQAVELDPANATYARAAEMARQSAVTQMVEESSRENAAGTVEGSADAAKLLQHALEIDPRNPMVVEHLDAMGDRAAAAGAKVGEQASEAIKAAPEIVSDVLRLAPSANRKSFHLRGTTRQAVMDVFRGYGIETSIDDSVTSRPVRMDLDDATFEEATHILGLLTQTFYEPLDPHRAIVAKDTRENRSRLQRLEEETIYLPALTSNELTDVGNLARNLFEAQQVVVEPSQNALTLRASSSVLGAFNRTIEQIEDGRNELDLEVKVIELAHVSTRQTGATFFQQTGVYNVSSEIQSILSQNASAVQQIISSGLVANANTLANQLQILAILLAAGQLTGPPFNSGFIPFGNGISQSILSPGPATLNMSLNSSDTRTLDDIHMRLIDNEDGTFKMGERYPIEQSSFSSAALPNISGISSLASSLQSQTIPQIQYEDIGLTLKVTPRVMRSNDVAMTLDLKIQALGGTALNNIPILDSRAVSGVLTVKDGETAVLVSDLSRTESRALNGLPGLGDIPGLEDISDITRDKNVARLLILVTPRVSRREGLQWAHGPMIRIDKGATGR